MSKYALSRYVCRLLLFLVALTALAGHPAYSQTVVADGFEERFVAGVPYPTALAVVPDGRVLISSQLGQVYILLNGVLQETPALDLGADVCTFRERGLVGLAVDPAFGTNRFIYVSYTFNKFGLCDVEWHGAPVGRVSRFVLEDNGTVDRASEKVLIDNVPSTIGVHNVDDVEFGRDGYLYVSVGDGGCDYMDDSGCFDSNDAARDMHTLLGKVLRITSDGGVPADNPFAGPGTAPCALDGGTQPGLVCREIFATGLRNPWRLAFDPNAPGTRFFINDVGQDTWEEVNEGTAGADFGWNVLEALCRNGSPTDCSNVPPQGLTNPIYFYDRAEGCASITGGAFVPNGAWPPEFDGAYLFSDYVCGRIFKLVRGSDGSFTRETFVSGLGDSSATDLQFVSSEDGLSLYFLSHANGGEVRRIVHVGGNNRRPRPALTATPTSGPVPLIVDFDASGSSDPDGDALTYEWNFGYATPTVSGVRVQHTFHWEGTYVVTVTARDAAGSTASAWIVIDAGNTAPEPVIVSPVADHTFAVGEAVVLRGRATDAEDGELTDAALTWRVVLHHNTHTHGFVPPTTGNAITFTAPGPENLEAAATSYLEVQLTATDARGLTSTVSQALRPRTTQVTFATQPAGATLRIDNATVTAPVTISSWVNFPIAVEAPRQTRPDGTVLVPQSWSHNKPAAHTLVTPATPTTYTALFVPETATSSPVATASSIETPDFPATNAFDGNMGTRWSSAYSDPQWLAIDLGVTTDIDRVVLSWEAAYATSYMIQVSDDGVTWRTVHQTTNGNGGTDDIPALAARGRYVRMFGTARATPWGYSLWEFQVFGDSGGGPGEPGATTPFKGTPASLPGTLQAENFDEGAAGAAYADGSPGNTGGEYRATDVDIEASADAGGGFNVGWISAGEWLQYTVNITTAGTYQLEFRVASAGGGGTFHLEVDGVDRTGPLVIPNTGDWQAWTTVSKTGVSLPAGTQVWRLVFDSAGPTGVFGNVNHIRVATGGGPTPGGSTPFNSVRTALPGTLQAENFDEGGAGVAFSDTSAGNSGGEYRATDVDIEASSDAGGGYNVGWLAPGEWLNYSVNVAAAGTYRLEFRVASADAGGTFHVEVDGVDKTGPLTIPNTGGWQAWTTIAAPGVNLSAGPQVWRVVIDAAGSVVGNLNFLRVTAEDGGTPPATPYGGAAVSLPGTIQAEQFDEGGAGIAYLDMTGGNTGGAFRATDVDIESTADAGGGYNVGWVAPGEWLQYTVNVTAAGVYDLEIRVASPSGGGMFHIEVNGVDVSGPLTVPSTGDWQTWTTVRRTGVTLGAGVQALRLVLDSNGAAGAVGNFNWVRVTSPGTGGAVAIQRAPYVQHVTPTSAVIVWTTKDLATAAVRYSAGTGSSTTASAETRFFSAAETGLAFDYFQHEAHLAGLTSGTQYTYDPLMGGIDATAGQDRFTTAPPVGSGSVRFLAFGDSGVGSAEQQQLATLMSGDTFDLAIHTGDVAYGNSDSLGGGDYAQFEAWVFGMYNAWMRSRPFFPSIGNHDDEVQFAQPYRNVFVLPDNGTSAVYPDNAERYYSFDYGPVHFVALDTEHAFLDPGRRQAQLAWLEADLASTAQPWRVVYFHRSPYSAGLHHGSDLAVRQAFAPIFEKYDVQLVMSGHEHIYERTVPVREFDVGGSPVTYIVTGGGGARLTAAGTAWWTALSASVHHYVRASADECTMRVEAVRMDGAVFDTVDLTRCSQPSAAPRQEDDDSDSAEVQLLEDARAVEPKRRGFNAPRQR